MTETPWILRSLGELVRSLPGAAALLDRHRIDFWCAGQRTLADAPSAAGVPAEPLARQLQELAAQLGSGHRDWCRATRVELIEHILSRYHEQHRWQLPELIHLSRRFESVHGDRADCPRGLSEHLEAMTRDLESHMQKEERVLFAMLLQGVPPVGLPPVAMMRFEHQEHARALERMVHLARGLQAPAAACNSWHSLISGLITLREHLMMHIHLENNILFEGLNASANGCGAAGQQPW